VTSCYEAFPQRNGLCPLVVGQLSECRGGSSSGGMGGEGRGRGCVVARTKVRRLRKATHPARRSIALRTTQCACRWMDRRHPHGVSAKGRASRADIERKDCSSQLPRSYQASDDCEARTGPGRAAHTRVGRHAENGITHPRLYRILIIAPLSICHVVRVGQRQPPPTSEDGDTGGVASETTMVYEEYKRGIAPDRHHVRQRLAIEHRPAYYTKLGLPPSHLDTR
jgi:hypothetical protein